MSYLDNWLMSKHSHCTLIPLVQECSVETTLAVYCLNPPEDGFGRRLISDDMRHSLRERGYTRLYILYLFSRRGDFSKLSTLPFNQLVGPAYNKLVDPIIPDVGKVFFAYGSPVGENSVKLIKKRSEEVRKRIVDIKPGIGFYYFGELSDSGYPKCLEEVTVCDDENIY